MKVPDLDDLMNIMRAADPMAAPRSLANKMIDQMLLARLDNKQLARILSEISIVYCTVIGINYEDFLKEMTRVWREDAVMDHTHGLGAELLASLRKAYGIQITNGVEEPNAGGEPEPRDASDSPPELGQAAQDREEDVHGKGATH